MDRFCEDCGSRLNEGRLSILPDTTLCVECVSSRGDVPRLKRYDDYDMRLEDCAQTLYYSNQYFDTLNARRSQVGNICFGESEDSQ